MFVVGLVVVFVVGLVVELVVVDVVPFDPTVSIAPPTPVPPPLDSPPTPIPIFPLSGFVSGAGSVSYRPPAFILAAN